MLPENGSVCRQPQESLLGNPAEETDGVVREAVIPGFRRGMVDVRVEGQRKPHVNVGEMHLLRPGSPRCVRRSTAHCRVDRFGPEEPGFAASGQPVWPWAMPDT